MNDLLEVIEHLRERLCSLVLDRELTDIEVVLCSQELDKLIIQYETDVRKTEFKPSKQR